MYSILHEMFKIASVSGAPPQAQLGELTTLPRPLVVRGFLPSQSQLGAFGACNNPNSGVLISRPIPQLLDRCCTSSILPQPRSACDATDHAQRLKPSQTKNPSYVATYGPAPYYLNFHTDTFFRLCGGRSMP